MAAAFPLPGLGAPLAPGLAAPAMPMPMPMAPAGMPMPGMMPMGMPAPPPPPEPPPAVQVPEEDWPELFTKVRGWYQDDREHWADWRDEAKKDFEFVAGKQWDERTERVLKAQMRPASTFNVTGAMIDAVSGYEVANRQEPRYIQRNMGAAGVSELTTAGARYFRDNTDAEHHESAAFRDTAICGLGCTETYIDYDDNEDGDYRKRRVSVFEVVPDGSAREDNLSDAKRIHRIRTMRVSDAVDMFPDARREDLHAAWADDESGAEPMHDDGPDRYETGDDAYPDTREICVVETQWWAFEPYMRFVDPFTGQQKRLSRGEFETLSQRMLTLGMPAPRGVLQRKKVWYRAFLGAAMLGVDSPPVQGHFSYGFITGKRDEVKGWFYGIVRPTRDPQQWLNKLFSTTMHILNTNAKGGIIAERGAFEDDRKAAEDWAKPDSIVFANTGAIAGQRIMPKPQGQVNPAFFQLMDFAMSMGPRVTGINLEFLGMKDNDQAGVLEYQRRQAGITILANLFDSLRLYRVSDGRYTLRLMQQYLSDGRLIRIVGEEGQHFLPLNRDATVGEYEVIVDDAPTSPNMKEQQWATIQSLLPILQPIVGNNPEAIAELMKDAPLAESRKAKLAEILMKKPDPQAQQLQSEQMAAQRAGAYAEINKKDAQAEKDRATALKTFAETVTPFLGVPPVLEGPFPVAPMPPPMPQMQPPGAPQMPAGPPQMPQGAPQGMMRPMGAPQPQMPPQAVPGAPGAPIAPPPGLRLPGQ